MKKLLALILSVCMILSTFAVMTVSAETENRDIAPESTVESATDGYLDNDAANMFDGDLNTYYMAGKVTDADGVELYTSSSNVVWIKLAEHTKVTRVEATFGSKADRTALFGNSGNQNQNFYMYLTDFGPDEGSFNGSNGIVTPTGKTAHRVTNGYSDQSPYTSMKKDVNEETAFTYLAIWGPYSAGLCISDLKIYADAEKKEEVIPPGATTQLVEKQITPVAAGFAGNLTSNAANIAGNVIDGDESTMAISDGYARHLYVDLGKAYNITKIEVVYPTETAITSFVTNNAIDTDPVANMNTVSQVYVSDAAPVEGSLPATRINPSTSVGKGTTATYAYEVVSGKETTAIKDLGNFRYISITQGTSSNPTAVAEVKIYGMVEEVIVPGGTVQLVEQQITPLSAAHAGNYITSAANNAANIIDGDESTMAISDGYARHMYIDLGEAYNITKIEVVYPTEAAIASFVTSNSIETDPVANMNTSSQVYVSDAAFTEGVMNGTRINPSTNVGKGTTATYTHSIVSGKEVDPIKDLGNFRYISITQGDSAKPTAVAEVRVYAMVEVIVDNSDAVNKNIAQGKQVYSNANNAEVLGYAKSMTQEMNAVDGNAGTIFAGGVYAINSGDTDINFETVIDLGDAYQITDVKYTPYGGETTSIYGSNSTKFDDLEAIASNVATTDNTVQEYTGINKFYRYIVVDRIGSENGQLLGIRDIEVYAAVQEADLDAATAYSAGIKVSLNKPVYHTGTIRFDGAKENMNDGIYDHGNDAEGTFVLSAASGQSQYAVMDLGTAYNISAVGLTQALGCTGFNNSSFKVIATNDTITESTDLTTVEWTELATGYAFPNQNSKYILPIDINNDYSYRYIGIKGASGMGVPFREMDVYASALSYDMGTYTAVASGRDVTVGFTSSEPSGVESAKVLIASYDANGVLIKLVNEDLDIVWSVDGGYASETFTGAIAEGAATKKVFFLDSLTDVSPLANSITLF